METSSPPPACSRNRWKMPGLPLLLPCGASKRCFWHSRMQRPLPNEGGKDSGKSKAQIYLSIIINIHIYIYTHKYTYWLHLATSSYSSNSETIWRCQKWRSLIPSVRRSIPDLSSSGRKWGSELTDTWFHVFPTGKPLGPWGFSRNSYKNWWDEWDYLAMTYLAMKYRFFYGIIYIHIHIWGLIGFVLKWPVWAEKLEGFNHPKNWGLEQGYPNLWHFFWWGTWESTMGILRYPIFRQTRICLGAAVMMMMMIAMMMMMMIAMIVMITCEILFCFWTAGGGQRSEVSYQEWRDCFVFCGTPFCSHTCWGS